MNEQHVITLPAQGLGLHVVILALGVVYVGKPPSGDVQIEGLDAPTSLPILSDPQDMHYSNNWFLLIGRENIPVVITVPAGGSTVRGIVNVSAIKILARNIEAFFL